MVLGLAMVFTARWLAGERVMRVRWCVGMAV